jgi:hypothetical protein
MHQDSGRRATGAAVEGGWRQFTFVVVRTAEAAPKDNSTHAFWERIAGSLRT